MARKALLIGTGTYSNNFGPLKSPLEDVRVLGELLRNPEIGGFEVEILTDLPSSNLRPKIETWYLGHSRDDFSLLFLAGHGVKDGDRKLHFAMMDTQKIGENLVKTTAISASNLSEWMGKSRAKRQAVILNCCFSGAFGDLVPMDDGEIEINEILGPEGRVVMTATSSMAYAFESKGRELSIYGHYLVEGLRTGAAATHGSDQITLDELHQYVSQKVQSEAPAMVPQWFAKGAGQGLRIAKVAIGDPRRKYEVVFEELVQQFGEEIRGFGLARLRLLQRQLNLEDSVVAEIKDRVLEPIRLRKEKISEYREIFTEGVKQEGYPFDETQLQNLMEIKKLLGLLDEDVAVVEAEVLAALPSSDHYVEPVIVEFDRLEELLQSHKWKEANDETLRLFLVMANRKPDENLHAWMIRQFPQDQLNTIDGLWSQASDGKFGLGIQGRLFAQNFGHLEVSKSDVWPLFDELVDWRRDYANFYNFSLNTVDGHLPHWRKLISGQGVSDRGVAFLKRGLDCPTIEIEVEHDDIEVVSAIDAITLKSEKGVDYTKLRDLLKAGEWEAADQETYRLMITTVGKNEGQEFDREDLENFPCEDLRALDNLWVTASNGHFGFSVQKKIWEKCGSPMSYNDDYEKFMEAVGWRSGDNFVSYSQYKFSSTLSPRGEFPGWLQWCKVFCHSLFSRSDF
ncbi:MAG: GUN4 domain-containing protein [Cyanobacteria bacterium]|nr:GUN4 domain-containing protein [Cyanobacteriota bacterium]